MTMQKMTLVAALNSALDEAMAKDETVFLIGEDIGDPAGGVMKVTEGLSTKYGDARVLDTPICEGAIAGTAVGAALGGMRPIAEIMFDDLIMLAMDQIINQGAKHYYSTNGRAPVPMTIRTGVASGHGAGATHSQSLEAFFMHAPGLKLGMPSTPHDAKGMLTSCIFDDDPCLLFEHYGLYQTKGEVPIRPYDIPIGQADVKREGSDVSLVTYGPQVHMCLEAADTLAEQGVNAEVVDLRWLVPLDRTSILQSVSKTKRAVVVHQATRFAGPGAEISSLIHEELFGELRAPVCRLGGPYVPVPASPALEAAYYVNADKVVGAVKRLL